MRPTAKDSHFLPAAHGEFGRFCLFRVEEISHQILNFVERLLALLYQSKKKINFSSFLKLFYTLGGPLR